MRILAIMIWTSTMIKGRTTPYIFVGGSITGEKYCNEIPHARLSRGAVGSDFVFMDDNARPHRTARVVPERY